MKFAIKFDDIYCRKCGEKIYIKDIFQKLQDQYEPDTDARGYISILTPRCDCGAKHKFTFNCNEYNGITTVCVKKAIITREN